MSISAPAASPRTLGQERTAPVRRWCTVVHDDPVNTMDYVVWVFTSYFAMARPAAERRMMQVHTTGRAVVSRGPRERMEVDVTAMHSYGLRATLEPEADGAPQDPGSADDGTGRP